MCGATLQWQASTALLLRLVAGLATGAIYALAAIVFTLLWQTSQTLNFAQGEFVMVPAFFALIAMKTFGLPFVAALVLVALAFPFFMPLFY